LRAVAPVSEEKVNVGVVLLLGVVTGVSAVSGATVSTVNEREAGVVSEPPAADIARTSNVWSPWLSAVAGVKGDVHAANARESNRHWKLTAPPEPVKVNVGVAFLIGPLGPPVICVSSVAATTNDRDTVGGSVNTPSIARTENV
jgi:hypothetical protein